MGNFENYTSVLQELQDFGLAINLLYVDSGKTRRVPVDTKKVLVDKAKSKTAGWYRLHRIEIDGKNFIVGSYGYWKGTDNNAQKIDWKEGWSKQKLTKEQIKAIADAHNEALKKIEVERNIEIDKCAENAGFVWSKYKDVGSADYLNAKGVGAFGIKFHPKVSGMFAVPVCDISGKIFALQFVRDKEKFPKMPPKQFYPKGAQIKGHFHTIGTIVGTSHLLIAEGYATAASLHLATGLPVVVAFNANNLLPVAKEIYKEFPRTKIVICADDDYLTDGNPGVTQAQNAALSVNGKWIKPDFIRDGQDIRNGEKLTDFNDLHLHPLGGLHIVAFQVMMQINGLNHVATSRLLETVSHAKNDNGSSKSVISLQEAVDRFVPLVDGSGKYVFDIQSRRISTRDQMMSLLAPKIRFDDVKSHPDWVYRGAFDIDQVGFDPSESDQNCKLNLWSGWPTKPAEHTDPMEQCKYLLNTLVYLCSGEANKQEIVNWLLNWLAYPIQNPGAKMQSAVVVHGPQGTGKSIFFEAVGKIYGEYSMVLSQGAIEDKFNSDWTSKKLFIIADEIVARQDMYHLKNQLKTLITGDYVRVNPKNLVAYKERNHMNLVFLSNEKRPVVLENDDRRHCVIWTPDKMDEGYYERLNNEIDNGGIEALHQVLLERDLGDFKPWTKPPMTGSKQDLIDLSKDSIQLFIEQWQSGYLDLPVCPALIVDFYDAYKKWCSRTGEYEQKERDMNNFLDKNKDINRAVKYVFVKNQRKSARMVIPTDDFYQMARDKGGEVLEKREDETEVNWCSRASELFRGRKNGDI